MTSFVITEVDKKADIAEEVIGGLVPMVADALIELAEKAKGMTFSDQETQQAVATR